MRFTILIFFLISFIKPAVYGQGIEFFHGTWEEAKAKAKESGKLVFVDAYTTWCGPCKRMAADIFPQPEVGTYYNANFINYKLDMEKGEGPAFAKKYGIRAYPTLLFINGEGEKVYNHVGGSDAKGLVFIGSTAIEKYDKSPALAVKYNGGDKSPELILEYIKALNSSNKSSLKVANEYLNGQKNNISDVHYRIIYEAATTSDSKPYEYLISNEKSIVKLYDQKAFDQRKYKALLNSINKSIEYDSPELQIEALTTAKKVLDKDNNKMFILETDLIHADATKNGQKYISVASNIGKNYNSKSIIDLGPIIKGLSTIYIGETDSKNTVQMLYSKQAQYSNDPSKGLEYATYLISLNDKENALKEALKAKALAEKQKLDTTKYDNLILKINSK